MKQVAKVVIVDDKNTYLLLQRSSTHPFFAHDADIPGGTLEDGEKPIEAVVREVFEETGITVNAHDVALVHKSTNYSHHGTEYSLYQVVLAHRPEVTLSWEHSWYQWVGRDELVAAAKISTDTYMHMVYDVLTQTSPLVPAR